MAQIALTPDQNAAVQQAAPDLNPQAAPSNLPGGAPALPASAPDSSTLGLPPTAAQPSLPTSAAPAQPAAPATGLGATPAPQTFAQKLAASLNRNSAANGTPGGWAKSLVGGAVDAISTGMGDAATGMKENPLKPGQSGALAGVMNTLAARQQRLGAEKQQAFDNSLKLRQENREDLESQYRIAMTQVQTVNLAKADARADQEQREKSAADGATAAKPLYAHHTVLGENVSDSDLMAGSGNGGPYDKTKVIAYPTKYEEGPDGTYRRTWTVFQRDASPVTINDPDTLSLLNTYGTIQGGKLTLGQTIPNGDTYDQMVTQALSAKKVQEQITKDADDSKIEQTNKEQTLQHNTDTTTLLPWFANHNGDPIDILLQAKNDKDPKTGQPTPMAMAATRELMRFKSEDLEKYQDHKDQEADKQRKQDEDEAVKSGKYMRVTTTKPDPNDPDNPDAKITTTAVVPNPNYRPQGANAGGGNANGNVTQEQLYQQTLAHVIQDPNALNDPRMNNNPALKARLQSDYKAYQQKQSNAQNGTPVQPPTGNRAPFAATPNVFQTSPNPANLRVDQKIITNGKLFSVVPANAGVPSGWTTTANGRQPLPASAPEPETTVNK